MKNSILNEKMKEIDSISIDLFCKILLTSVKRDLELFDLAQVVIYFLIAILMVAKPRAKAPRKILVLLEWLIFHPELDTVCFLAFAYS